MCGRFTLTLGKGELARETGLPEGMFEGMEPSFNRAPGQELAALVWRDGGPKLERFRWGLVPEWTEDPSVGNRMINARSESLEEKPSFAEAFRSRRCLILSDGFYDWPVGRDRESPHYVRLKSRRLFAFAGLWSSWKSPQGEELRTCTIITCPANERLAPIHPRMPVILPKSHWKAWLDPEQDPAVLSGLMASYAPGLLETYRVSGAVNAVAHDSPDCIRENREAQMDLF